MKTQLLNALKVIILLLIPTLNFAQAPPLGTAAQFVLFSSVGAVGNTGISLLTGNVGTNSGSSTGFGNVNGVMHDNDGASAQCAADLLIAYNQLNSTIPTFFPAPLLGNGQTLNAGVYSISGAATLNLDLTLNAQGNANAVFIFQIQGPFSTNADSKIKLINGAQACNVFWKVEGLVSMASGTTMRGTVIANNAAINMNTGDTLEGRALSTTGAVSVSGVLAYTPIGCGSPILIGPAPPALASTECYALFSSDGPVTNAGITYITGDIGTNVGLTTGFNALNVTGTIHPIPDGSTAQCAADLLNVYTYLNTLPYDIELLYPAQFGNNLVLTPHTYLLNAATVLTDTLYLNAQGIANAVFVIQINGALSTSTYSKVLLINGAQAKNVYWKVDGAVDISDYSVFKGMIVCNNGAISLTTGVILDGRALTTTGALSTAAIMATIPLGCSTIDRKLNLTVFLEGLWLSPTGPMHEAYDDVSMHWGAGIADHIKVELHNSTSPYGLVWSHTNVVLSTAGAATVTVPSVHNGNYYIVLKHRNSIETWSSSEVKFAAAYNFQYDFTSTQFSAYGNNLKQSGSKYLIFTGDVNQDWVVDGDDTYQVYDSYQLGDMGYLVEDVNGDGVVDSNDVYLVYDNYMLGVFAAVP